MSEYITKEQVIEWFRPYGHTDEGVPYYVLVTDIREMKSADVAPVRHGRWIASHDEFCACSICKYPVYAGWNQTNYCPNCGAMMDGGDGNADSVD